MLMTHTPPEYPLPTAECLEQIEQIGIPDVGPRLKPDGEDNETAFSQQFSRCRELLYFIALRILNCAEQAETAIRNCRLTASRNLQRFQSEGAFKSWLVRILIDEATLLRSRESNSAASTKSFTEAR
jgi:DNA-directed RNA polymerase specialized sigma24 family protein